MTAKNKEFTRDGRSPIPQNEVISRTMSAIKGKNTKPELLLRKALYHNGLSGYRLHWKKAPGRPDICYPGKKLAIFVHGCYWHRCPLCNPSTPKTHIEFWTNKFEKNVQRDKRKIQELLANGWKVKVFWECEIKNSIDSCINVLKRFIENKGIN
ncbi:very short patch repair endonuclease [candidate division KSB1 bacterium]